jgi:hypothetical protein
MVRGESERGNMPTKKKAAVKALRKKRAYKRVAPVVTNKHPALEHFLKILTGLYPCDDWSPGIVISYLSGTGEWYGAVYQYPKGAQGQKNWSHGDGGKPKWRTRLHSVRAATFDDMITDLIAPWDGITLRKGGTKKAL